MYRDWDNVTGGPSSYPTLVWWYPIYMGVLYCNVLLHRSFPHFTILLQSIVRSQTAWRYGIVCVTVENV
jgi:hypothetical protein